MRLVIRELFETAILALLIFLALQFSIRNYRVEGPSMRPTLDEGEYVIVNKLVYLRLQPQDLAAIIPFVDVDEAEAMFPFHPPERGEIIIFRFPKNPARDFVKRVIGVPGETVEIRQGAVFVDGTPLDEPYITARDSGSMSAVHLANDSYFVLGDNRRASNDSRDWGAVPGENIIGRAWISFWPLDRVHALQAFTWPWAKDSSH